MGLALTQRGSHSGDARDGWTAPSREVKIVLEGTLKIEIEDGPTLELEAGDMASIPKGTTAWWSISDGYREFWVLDDEGTPA